MKAIIEVDVPDYQIGQKVSIYFKDSMMIKGVVQEPCDDAISRQAVLDKWENTTLRGRTEFEQVIMMLPSVNPQERTGHWVRMSDMSEQEDDRYKCSHCGNVIHHKNKMDLYTFNSWCGRCGSDNGRKMEVDI